MVYTFLTSGEIISHNTVVWTGDVNLEYKIVLVLVLWAVIRTKLKEQKRGRFRKGSALCVSEIKQQTDSSNKSAKNVK